jgi:hypothetical protein
MNDSLENREAIQGMKDANASSMSAEDQLELVEQAIVSAVSDPKTIRSASNEEIESRPLTELIAAHEFVAQRTAAANPFGCIARKKLIPPGCG